MLAACLYFVKHLLFLFFFFFFNDTATTEIYTLSLHDALPICEPPVGALPVPLLGHDVENEAEVALHRLRSEEHTSELQSPCNLVCRLLLEKKKRNYPSRLSSPTQRSNYICYALHGLVQQCRAH